MHHRLLAFVVVLIQVLLALGEPCILDTSKFCKSLVDKDYVHPCDPTSFITCVRGVVTTTTKCPEGEYFDQDLFVCGSKKAASALTGGEESSPIDVDEGEEFQYMPLTPYTADGQENSDSEGSDKGTVPTSRELSEDTDDLVDESTQDEWFASMSHHHAVNHVLAADKDDGVPFVTVINPPKESPSTDKPTPRVLRSWNPFTMKKGDYFPKATDTKVEIEDSDLDTYLMEQYGIRRQALSVETAYVEDGADFGDQKDAFRSEAAGEKVPTRSVEKVQAPRSATPAPKLKEKSAAPAEVGSFASFAAIKADEDSVDIIMDELFTPGKTPKKSEAAKSRPAIPLPEPWSMDASRQQSPSEKRRFAISQKSRSETPSDEDIATDLVNILTAKTSEEQEAALLELVADELAIQQGRLSTADKGSRKKEGTSESAASGRSKKMAGRKGMGLGDVATTHMKNEEALLVEAEQRMMLANKVLDLSGVLMDDTEQVVENMMEELEQVQSPKKRSRARS